MRSILTVLLVGVLGLAGFVTSAFAQQKPPARGIVNITGQLYRAQNDNHYTVFLVTPEGIIMSDPINRDFARYLKAEFATRFKVPVRYLLYTHKDWDHASGGVVFADTAEFVGHQNMRAGVALPPYAPLPAEAQKMDANKNGLLERSEASGGTAQNFELYRREPERHSQRGRADSRAGERRLPSEHDLLRRHTVTLGGKRVMMMHLGIAHTNDSTVFYFPDERAVFSADVMQIKRLPQSLAPSVGAYIDALRTIVALDFDHALTGHALAGTKKDAMMTLQYLEDLATGVAAGIGAGRSLQEIQKSLMLERLQGLRAMGHAPHGPHRSGLRVDEGHQAGPRRDAHELTPSGSGLPTAGPRIVSHVGRASTARLAGPDPACRRGYSMNRFASVVLVAGMLGAGQLALAQIANPIPAPITKQGLRVEIKDVARLPDSRGLRPAQEDTSPASWARVNFVRDLPDGRRFANDTRGRLYLLDRSGQPSLYADLAAVFPLRMVPEPSERVRQLRVPSGVRQHRPLLYAARRARSRQPWQTELHPAGLRTRTDHVPDRPHRVAGDEPVGEPLQRREA